MYLISAGCSSLLHLAIQFPVLVGALTLAGFATQATNPGPGDRFGTKGLLTAVQNELVQAHPELVAKTIQLRDDFNQSKSAMEVTESQVRQVLSITEPCTDRNVQDVMGDPDLRKQVAWVVFLDAHARSGPQRK